MTEPKYCVDCRWATKEGSGRFALWMCDNPKAPVILPPDLVTGEPRELRRPSCDIARQSWGNCGRDAKLFEPIFSGTVGFGEALDEDAP